MEFIEFMRSDTRRGSKETRLELLVLVRSKIIFLHIRKYFAMEKDLQSHLRGAQCHPSNTSTAVMAQLLFPTIKECPQLTSVD